MDGWWYCRFYFNCTQIRTMRHLTSIVLAVVFPGFLSAQTFVFLGSYNWEKTKEGIYIYQLDTTTGQLTKVAGIKDIRNPSFITLSPDGRFLYACTDSKTPNAGSVSSFAFDAKNKTLTYLNSQPSKGENPVYVSVHKTGRWLADANYTEASVSVYPILENGAIDSIAQNIHFTDSSIDKERQSSAHIHSAVFAPDGDYLFLPDLGADKIRCYEFSSESKAPLISHPELSVATKPGSGPRHFIFHPNGRFAYCIEEMGGAVNVFSYEQGVLQYIQRIPTHSKELKGYESSDLHISPDGRFLYATNRGTENNIAIFRIRFYGMLKRVGYQPVYGDHPRTFAIDPSGKFIIVTNVVSGNVVVFRRNIKNGLLTKVAQTSDIPNVSCVQIKHYHE